MVLLGRRGEKQQFLHIFARWCFGRCFWKGAFSQRNTKGGGFKFKPPPRRDVWEEILLRFNISWIGETFLIGFQAKPRILDCAYCRMRYDTFLHFFEDESSDMTVVLQTFADMVYIPDVYFSCPVGQSIYQTLLDFRFGMRLLSFWRQKRSQTTHELEILPSSRWFSRRDLFIPKRLEVTNNLSKRVT